MNTYYSLNAKVEFLRSEKMKCCTCFPQLQLVVLLLLVMSVNAGVSSTNSNRASSSLQRQNATKTQGIDRQAFGSRRRACGLYIWDVPSALLYHWCRHLLKDAVYEGRGGKKVRFLLNSDWFIRMES